LARRRQHGRGGRAHGVRLPAPRLPANRAQVSVSITAQSLREQAAWACRILALEGYADLTLGHVSIRARDGDAIYIKRKGVALDEVGPEDVVAVDDPAATLHLEPV